MKEQLYGIMYDFLRVETDINALRTLSLSLEKSYRDKEEQEIADILNIVVKYLESVLGDIRNTVGHMDQFLIEHKNV